MKKTVMIILVLIALAVIAGAYFTHEKNPPLSQNQQEIREMERYGTVKKVTPDRISVEINQGKLKGQTKTYTQTDQTTVQIHNQVVNKPGAMVDLTRHFKLGDTVQILAEQNNLAVIHRNLRPTEREE
ncbi:MAG: hypothetical protein ACM3QZ_10485 [Solirubrobacterales bacterium]